MAKVSVITTVKNEANSIKVFLDSLLAQSELPDEIVITDGGSTDESVEIIKDYIEKGIPIKLIVAKGANISRGRNISIQNSSHDIIASTDVGCKLDRNWLRNIVRPFEEDPIVDVVGGFFKVAPETFFEECVAALTGCPPEGTDPDAWLPSSRSIAFRKSAWEAVGGYPEWLDHGEDTFFALQLRKAGFEFRNAEDAWVYWRPRSNLRALFRQYYGYARGDGRALVNPIGYMARAAIYGAMAGLLVLAKPSAFARILLGSLATAYLGRRILKAWRRVAKWPVLFIIPFLAIVNDLADISGYLRGVIEHFMTRRE